MLSNHFKSDYRTQLQEKKNDKKDTSNIQIKKTIEFLHA